MELLEWKEEYRIGNDVIDEEHHRLFVMANEILQIRNPQNEMEKIRRLIHSLYDYMKNHFSHEEAYMAQLKFSGIVTHKIKHSQIIDEMTRIMKETHRITAFYEKLKEMMVGWVLRHIIEEDMKIKGSAQSDLK